MSDYYKTVKDYGCDEFIEKRSRFIGYCKPIKTEEEAIEFINHYKKLHWDATHNCYAYCLRDGQIKRYSDDGEPQGTAGMPMLDVLVKSGVTDVVVVVTRYFGGVLLGTGGLVRAYSQGTKVALEASKIIKMELCALCSIKCSYNQYGKVNTLIMENNGVLDDSDFSESVILNFHISVDNIEALNKNLADATCGEVEVEVLSEKYYEMM